MSTSPTLTQVRFRIRTDTGAVDATPTWAAAEDTGINIPVETTFRIRFIVQNTGTASGAGPFILRVSKNSGAYTAVTTSTGATLGAQSADASSDADAAVINTLRLTAGAGTGVQGVYDETGSTTYSLVAGTYVEWEFGLILKTAGATTGDAFDFELYNSTTAFTTYSKIPRITVPQVGTTFTGPERFLGQGIVFNAAGNASLVSSAISGVAVLPVVGDLVVVTWAADNSTTANADAGVVTSVTDSKGNTYVKAQDWQFGSPGALAGTACGVWYSQITTALVAGNTITVNLSSSTDRDAVIMRVGCFPVQAGKTVYVEASNTATGTGTTLASLDATTASIECLRIRVASLESNQALAFDTRKTSGWSSFETGITNNSGTSLTSQGLVTEFRINIGTGAASAPAAFGSSTDHCSVYVAFRATLPNHACLANDVSSASSVTTAAITQVHTPLANDVLSASSVTKPVVRQLRDDLLANDVKSNSSVTQPAVKQLQGLLANDVLSASSVSQPAAGIVGAATIAPQVMHQYGMRRAG